MNTQDNKSRMKGKIKRQIRAVAHIIQPTVQIGKSGLTASLIKEIKHQLNKNKIVKIKLLKSFFGEKDKKQEANKIAEFTNSHLIEVKGNTVVLKKK